MRIVLMHDVIHTGKRGQVVDVKRGYARNYLLPKGLALEATPGNLKVFEQQRRKIEARHAQERDAAAEIAASLAGVRVEIAKRATEAGALYGSVTASEVAEALEAKGIEIDPRQVDLEGGIKAIGDHEVRIDLHSEVVAEVVVTVVAQE